MNQQNVAKREILDYKQFLGKVHDDTYKPFSPENQTSQPEKTGLSKITREPAYDYAGYADSVFGQQSKVDVPGYRISIGNQSGTVDASGAGGIFNMGSANESEEFEIKKLSDF
jgi:hypothetical protein